MQEKVNKIYNGNNLDVLKNFEDNSVDLCCSDVPYALSDVNPLAMIKDGVNNKSGFMGKTWDCLPTIEMLKEFYRVLKTGGFFVTTFASRQDLQTVFIYRLMEAGFDVSFSPIYWAYKSGFPKASNYAKVMQKHQGVQMEVVGQYNPHRDGSIRQKLDNSKFSKLQQTEKQYINGGMKDITKPTTPEAIYCDGLYSLSLKPALEPILICQKPHNKAKYKQALDWYCERKELLDRGIPEEDLSLYTKNASGGVWIDNGRIPINNIENEPNYRPNAKNHKRTVENGLTYMQNSKTNGIGGHYLENQDLGFHNSNGRFPANLLCGLPISKEELRSEYPEATEEELEKMVNMIENPIDVGRVSKSVKREAKYNKITEHTNTYTPNYSQYNENSTHDDTGDLSRYFSLTAWSKKHFPNLHNIAEKTLQLQDDVEKTGDCLFVTKPSPSEKNAGLDGFEEKNVKDGRQAEVDNAFQRGETLRQNTHPTTKPIVLYNYLLEMFSKEGDIILDPFCGSGVTPIACVLTNRRYIGIEMEAEYCKIAEARVEYWKQQKEGVKIPSASKKNVSASKKEEQETLF